LFLALALGQPYEENALKMLADPTDHWHAGPCHEALDLPNLADFVQSTWMVNYDPSTEIEVTSQRISLHACLVQTEVLRKMGFLHAGFSALEAAALEGGHRLFAHGALMRHVLSLVACREATTDH
jgi:hypothetical protein